MWYEYSYLCTRICIMYIYLSVHVFILCLQKDDVVEFFLMFQVVSWTRYRLFFLFMAIHIRGVPEIHLTELPWPPTDALLSSPSIFVLACLVSSSNTYSLKQTVPSYQNAGHVLQPFAIILFDYVRVCRHKLA